MKYELYHAGVPGMKWGVRNDKKKSASTQTVTKVKRRGSTTTISSRKGNQRASMSIKAKKGAKVVAKTENTRIKVIVSNTANVAAGSLRVAAAFVPGLSVLNGVATAASLVGTVSTLK